MNKLLELRELNNLNQTQMGLIIGKSQQYYERYENGKTKLPIELAIKFADYFNVSLDYLCGRPFNNGIGYITENQRNIINKVKELDNWQLEKLDAWLDAMIIAKKENPDKRS